MESVRWFASGQGSPQLAAPGRALTRGAGAGLGSRRRALGRALGKGHWGGYWGKAL